LLQLFCQGPFGSAGPALHGDVTQTTHLLDQERLNLIGPLHRAICLGGDFQNVLESLQQLRMLAQLLDQLLFGGAQFGSVRMLVFHPHCNY
jgi:hypothetical protein